MNFWLPIPAGGVAYLSLRIGSHPPRNGPAIGGAASAPAALPAGEAAPPNGGGAAPASDPAPGTDPPSADSAAGVGTST